MADPLKLGQTAVASTSSVTIVNSSPVTQAPQAPPQVPQAPIIGHNALTGSPVQGTPMKHPHTVVMGPATSSPAQGFVPVQAAPVTDMVAMAASQAKILDKQRIQNLVQEIDPLEQLDEDVEEMMLQIADDFIDNVVTAACQLAKHRHANTVEVKDVQLHLERNWNMWVPGFGSGELKPYKKSSTTEAHRQRLALIKKTLKKY